MTKNKYFSKLQIVIYDYFSSFLNRVQDQIKIQFKQFIKEIENKKYFDRWLDFYIASSAVYSSKIEGNGMDFQEYWEYKSNNKKPVSKDHKEIIDLVTAYEFALNQKLNYSSFLDTHKIFSRAFLVKNHRGIIRSQSVGVYGGGKLVYLAVEPEYAEAELLKLFSDIKILLRNKLTIEEIFYFASMIHLVFVKIHPFMDGNGRAARLLEKWFLAIKTGKSAWILESEKFYFLHRMAYYKAVHLGPNYYECRYEKCFPFLLMLPDCLDSMIQSLNQRNN